MIDIYENINSKDEPKEKLSCLLFYFRNFSVFLGIELFCEFGYVF